LYPDSCATTIAKNDKDLAYIKTGFGVIKLTTSFSISLTFCPSNGVPQAIRINLFLEMWLGVLMEKNLT